MLDSLTRNLAFLLEEEIHIPNLQPSLIRLSMNITRQIARNESKGKACKKFSMVEHASIHELRAVNGILLNSRSCQVFVLRPWEMLTSSPLWLPWALNIFRRFRNFKKKLYNDYKTNQKLKERNSLSLKLHLWRVQKRQNYAKICWPKVWTYSQMIWGLRGTNTTRQSLN